jgi:glyoxylate/hydroxypyruvate reductase A
MKIVFFAPEGRPDPWVDGLRARLPAANVSVWTPGAPPADYAVVWSPPQQLADEQPHLRAVFNLGAGVDALLKRRWAPGIRLVRLDDAGMAVQMAEYACEAVIRHFRQLDLFDRRQREGVWQRAAPRRRAEWPVGVLGLGVLGSRVAQALASFGFPVLGYSRTPRALPGIRTFHETGGTGHDLEAFLAGSRHLVNLLPLTPATENLLDRHTLSRLIAGGLVINLARGAHVVDEDLVALIDEGHLDGAVLDVFREEPLPAGHPFWRHPRIRLTPHVAAFTLRDESLDQIATKIAAVHRGEPVAGTVDPCTGY